METLVLLLLLVGAICFALGVAGVPARIDWTNAGLLCWILTVLLPALDRIF